MRVGLKSVAVVALSLGVVATSGCPTAECQYYNDCPNEYYCSDEMKCVAYPGQGCTQDGSSPFFADQGSLEGSEHWSCNLPPVATDDAPHFTGVTGSTVLVSGGSSRILLDYVGPADLTGQRMYFGIRGERTYNYIEITQDLPRPMPFDLFIKPTAASADIYATVAFDDGSGSPDRPSLGPDFRIPMKIIGVSSGDIQVSATWGSPTDVDLYVEDPEGNIIFYGEKEAPSGGRLDLDSNAACTQPFYQNENIFWPLNAAPTGHYKVWVNLWSQCEHVSETTFRLTIGLRQTDFVTHDGVLEAVNADPGFIPNAPGVGGFVRAPDFEFDF